MNESVEIRVGGVFGFECFDKDGNLKWQDTAKNAVTLAGLNDLLDTYFGGAPPLTGFALGLITGPSASLKATDSHGSHPGWDELTSYTVDGNDLVRPTWVAAPAVSARVANQVQLSYRFSGASVISGAFLVGGDVGGTAPSGSDANLKGSIASTPVLWAHALLGNGNQRVVGGDILKITYLVNAASL